MSHTIVVESPADSRVTSPKVLDETVANVVEQEPLAGTAPYRTSDEALKWACMIMLIVTAVVSPYEFTPYSSAFQTAVRFAVALGAVVLIAESLRRGRYIFAGLFAGIALLFNPVLPALDLSENRLIVLISALPFLASLIWTKRRFD
jgi:hypothetical protein